MTSENVIHAIDHYELMGGCHDESQHRVDTQAVVVSVEGGIATSTHYGCGEMTQGRGEPLHSGATTRATGGGERSSSLVIRSVRCAETVWQR